MGWVKSVRDLGGVIFVDMRDRYGVTQAVFRPELLSAEHMEEARQISFEFVIAVKGTVQHRPDGSSNPDMATGEIEVHAEELKILNRAAPLPFLPADDPSAGEELRLKYRYLDLRGEGLQSVFALRHGAYQSVRRCLSGEGFLEIETPMLVRPTPEGARDFLVPSRVQRGKFFALPQSPQLYKQLLMISGFDRYFQLARCLRDEDLRADRQPEHTQIDLEMSFCREEDVFGVVERMFSVVFEENLGVKLPVPFPRLSYDEAMTRFGSDKPDMRIPLEIADVTAGAASCGFSLFEDAVKAGGKVSCLSVPAELSRKQITELETLAKSAGASALFWARVSDNKLEGGVSKSIGGELAEQILGLTQSPGVVLLTAGGRAFEAMGLVRASVGSGMPSEGPAFRFAWINEFPLFSWNEEEDRWEPTHHMFSMPLEEHMELMDTDPGKVRGRVYDLVCNGVELGSGSMRIHTPELQFRVMKTVGVTPEEAQKRFGFLLDAMQFGAPPHGGIALGFDRIVMIMAGRSTIRDTIAFPKTTSASSLMDGSPSEAEGKDLGELGIKLV
jgi:aspartyl-tRNA synthetase